MNITRRKLALLGLSTALAAPGFAQAAEKTIAFLRGGPDPYYQYGMDAAQVAADKLGVKLITYTANNDPTQELANVQDAITKGVDGILIYAVSLSSEKAAIAQAKRAGVPIFFQYGYDPFDPGGFRGYYGDQSLYLRRTGGRGDRQDGAGWGVRHHHRQAWPRRR